MDDRTLDRLFERFLRRGDVAALGEVFDQAAPELLRIARHLVGNAAEAEDLVQSTFVTAIERAAEFDGERRLVPWLVGITARHAANLRRKRTRASAAELTDDDAIAANDSGKVEERELVAKLREVLAQLPETLRRVVAPHLLDGKRPQEIAAELGLSPGAARVRLHRGLERVRRALPVGFAAGAAAVSITSTRGLAAVRSQVLACAEKAAPQLAATSAASTATTVWLGGSVVMQRFVLVAAAVVLAGSVWFFGARSSAPNAVEPSAQAAAPLAPTPSAPLEHETAPEPERVDVAPHGAAAATGVTFQGRVVDRVTSSPIGGARVWTTPRGESERVQRAVSASDGAFEFEAPAEEEPTLMVEADGYAPTAAPLSPERLARFRESAGRAELDGGARVALYEIRLRRGVELEGRVVRAADRSPVAAAELVLVGDDGQSLFTLSEHVVGRTDAAGVMHFDGLVAMPDEGEGRGTVLFAVAAEGVGWTRIARPGERERIGGIEIAIEPPFDLELRVLDAAGETVAGAEVTGLPLHDPFPLRAQGLFDADFLPVAPALMQCFAARTDGEGVARLPRLLRSIENALVTMRCQFLVTVDAGERGAYRGVLPFDCAQPGAVTVTLATQAEGLIRGRVTDVRGIGIAGATVKQSWPPRETTTAGDGAWELARLPGDVIEVSLEASKPGFVTARRSLEQVQVGGLVDGQDFVLRAPLAIEGRVIDESGAPIAGMNVYAYGEGDQWAHTPFDRPSGADGRFRIEDASEGEWELQVAAASPELSSDFVWSGRTTRARGGDRGVELVLTRRAAPSCRLEVEVVDATTGAALDPVHAEIHAVERGDARFPTAKTQPGAIVCEDLAPGRYVVWAAVAGRANGVTVVEVAADAPLTQARLEVGRPARARVSIDLSRVGRAEGLMLTARLDTPSGLIPGAAAFTSGSLLSAHVVVGAERTVALDDLTPGAWRIELMGIGVRCAPALLELSPGGEREIEMTAEPAGVIEFVLSSSPRRGWILIEHTVRDGAWSRSNHAWSGELDPPPPLPLTVDPGRVQWRVWFLAEPDLADKRLVAETREGESEVAAGQRLQVVLDVVMVDGR